MSKKKIVNWGIIGCGKHATQVKIPAFSDCSIAKLHCLGTQSREKLKQLSSLVDDVCIYQDYQQVLEDPAVDAVYIGLPNNLHAHWSRKAINAGKHVLCDKPAALDCAEARETIELAKQNSLFFAPAFMYRHHPQYHEVRKILADNVLGKIRLIEGHFHYCLEDFNNIRWRKEAGGGALLDVGCYVVDAAQYILDEALKVVSANIYQHPIQDVDETVIANLLSESGTSVNLCVSANMPRQNSLKIYGTRGILEISRSFIVPRNSSAELVVIDSKSTKVKRIKIEPANQYALELEAFSQLILGEQSKRELFSNPLNYFPVLDEIRNCARQAKA